MRNFGSATQYTTAGIYTWILATVSSHFRTLAVMVLMILFGGAAWGQTPLTGNINWTTSTHNKTYKLASCDAAYTITKSSNTADVNGSFMNFQLPDGAADNGCKIKITLTNCNIGCHGWWLLGFGRMVTDKLTINGTELSASYGLFGEWNQPSTPQTFESTTGELTVSLSDDDSQESSSWTIEVTCTGCCDLDAEIVVDKL